VPSVVLDGLGIPESPRWHDGRLWFCNWTTSEVVAVDAAGSSQVMATVDTSVPYSIDWLPDGTLLVVSGKQSTVLAADRGHGGRPGVHETPRFDLYADLSAHGSTFNEIVVDAHGNAYVNFDGIVLVRPDGSAEVVAHDLRFGNGMAISPDGSTLVVAESHGECLTAFTINSDATLSDRRVWADLAGDNPDGICMDAEGAVWYASVPGRHCVRVREGGEVVRTVDVDRGAFACMLGGADGTSLYIAAAEWRGMDAIGDGSRTGQILVEPVDVPHAGRP
jgi:sugar lactone lactonase YvrE